MANNNNMLQLCRLCLVKDDVNIPIFEDQGDIRQIFLKISSCLPVKVAREDRLPKKICDGCSYKLDMLYEFWNTSANAEKQLLSWLGEAGVPSKMADGALTAVAQQMKPAEAFVKEETLELPDGHADDDDKEYLFAQQKVEESASAGPSATVTSNEDEEPPPKRARRTAAVKAAIAMDQESDDDDDSGEPLTKIEDESEDSDGEDHVPAFVDVPSTSADDQPGPSGVGKDGVEAPLPKKITEKQLSKSYKLKELSVIIKRKKLQPTVRSLPVVYEVAKPKRKYTCYTCWQKFDYKHEVNQHRIMHEQEEKAKEQAQARASTPRKGTELATASKKPVEETNKPVAAPADSPSYHCESCEVSFGSVDEMKKHPKNNCRFNCSVCSRTYNTVHGFTIHILQHKINSAKPTNCKYDCAECSATFSDIIQMRSHTIVTHKIPIRKEPVEDEEGDDFTCEQCFDVFVSRKELNEHMEFHVELQSSDMPKDAFGENSGADFDEENDVKIPISLSDLDSLNTSIIIPKDELFSDDEAGTSSSVGSLNCRVLKPTKSIPRFHFNCVKCQRIYMDKSEFEEHLIEGGCTQIKTCSACELEFEDNYKYYKHVKQIHGTVLICKYCFEILPDGSSMDKHKLLHLKSFKNVCKICFRIMETYEEFCEHLKNHLNI